MCSHQLKQCTLLQHGYAKRKLSSVSHFSSKISSGSFQNSNFESHVSEKKAKTTSYLSAIKKTLATFTFKQRQEINIDGVVLRFYFWQNVRTSSIFVTIFLLSFSLEYSQHVFENHRGSLKQVVDIVIRYQLLNRHFRRKELIGELL